MTVIGQFDKKAILAKRTGNDGSEEIWMFDFDIDDFDGDLTELKNNIDLIPMITGLEETATNLDHYTIASGDNQNIVFLFL